MKFRWLGLFIFLATLGVSGCGGTDQMTPLSGIYEVQSEASSVEFTSIKNGDLAVTGYFDGVSGNVTVPGEEGLSQTSGTFKLDLKTIETGLDERNKNIIEAFFRIPENEQFRYATFSFDSVETGQEDLKQTNKPIRAGASGSMTLAGQSVDAFIPLEVTRTGPKTLRITSRKPWVLSIEKFGLGEPLKALMELCGHKNVSDAVPLTFDLQLKKVSP